MEPQLPQPLETLKISNRRIDFPAAGIQLLEKYSG
jgi:hypothetical protein